MRIDRIAAVCGMVSMAAGAAGCGDSAVSVSGRVGSGYTLISSTGSPLRSDDKVGGTMVNQIVAVPHRQGDVTPERLERAQRISIDDAGGFSLSLSPEDDWVAFLVNTTLPPADSIVGYVTISAGSDGMVQMPVDELEADADLGELTRSGEEALSSNEAGSEEVAFSLSAASLTEIARNDEGYKSLLNGFVNYRPENGVYHIPRVSYGFVGDLANIGNASPGDLSFDGFHFFFETNDPAYGSFDDICDGSTLIELIPPEPIGIQTGSIYGPDAPITNQAMERDLSRPYCFTEAFNVDYQGESPFFGAPTGNFDVIVPGIWRMRIDGVDHAAFDFAAGAPISAGFPTVPVLVPIVDADANGVIQSVTVEFYRYDVGTTQYVEITDLEALGRLFARVEIEIINADDFDLADHITLKEPGGALGTVTYRPTGGSWYIPELGPGDGMAARVDQIGASFQMGGNDFSFGWARPL